MLTTVTFGRFEWDRDKEGLNKRQHGLDFSEASFAFSDPDRIIATDQLHSKDEPRYFCIGKIGNKVATVRFTMRGRKVRIIGAGYWRKGKKFYEKENAE